MPYEQLVFLPNYEVSLVQVTYAPEAATLIAISGAVQPCKSIQVTSTLPSILVNEITGKIFMKVIQTYSDNSQPV